MILELCSKSFCHSTLWLTLCQCEALLVSLGIPRDYIQKMVQVFQETFFGTIMVPIDTSTRNIIYKAIGIPFASPGKATRKLMDHPPNPFPFQYLSATTGDRGRDRGVAHLDISTVSWCGVVGRDHGRGYCRLCCWW